jgi:hypothetical protein
MIRFLEGLAAPSRTKGGDNRSVMPLDVRGCTRATLKASACALSVPCLKRLGNPLNRLRAWDRDLQLSPLNEEFPVGASHQLASITSLPFVHTARRYYRSNDVVRSSDWHLLGSRARSVEELVCREEDQTGSFRGSKSRNKVSVGEPAEGSLPILLSRELSFRLPCSLGFASVQQRDKLGGSGLSPRDLRDHQTAAYSAQVSLSPPLGLPDGTRSGERRGRRPLVDPPFGEGPRGLVP